MKKQDEIEELFSSTFANFESMPPLDVKSAIDDQLFNGKPPVSDRRKGFIWIFSSIILIGIVSFFALKNGRNNNPVLAKNEISVQEHSGSHGKIETKNNENYKAVSQSETKNSKKEIINQIEEYKVTQQIDSKETHIKEIPTLKNKSELAGNKINSKKQKIARFKATGINTKSANSVKNNDTESTSKEVKNELSSSINKIEKNDNSKEKPEITKNAIFSNEVIAAKDKSIEKSNNSVENTLNENENSVAENIQLQDTTTQIQWSEETGTPSVLKGFDASQIKALSPWSISLYSGGTFGSSFLNNVPDKNHKMKEQVGFSASLEANYRLNARLGISAGIDFNSRKDIFYKVVPAGDSIIDGVTTQYIYFNPVTQDSIIDTIISPNYVVLQSEYNQNQRIQHNSFALPVYLSLNIFSKGNWNMLLNAGLRISYVQNKLAYNPIGMIAPDFKSFGLRVNMRPEITYSIKKFGLGCYMNLGYDALPAVELKILNESFQPTFQYFQVKRTRIDYGFGLVLKYHF